MNSCLLRASVLIFSDKLEKKCKPIQFFRGRCFFKTHYYHSRKLLFVCMNVNKKQTAYLAYDVRFFSPCINLIDSAEVIKSKYSSSFLFFRTL